MKTPRPNRSITIVRVTALVAVAAIFFPSIPFAFRPTHAARAMSTGMNLPDLDLIRSNRKTVSTTPDSVSSQTQNHANPTSAAIPIKPETANAEDTIGVFNANTSFFDLRHSNSAGQPDNSFSYGPAGAGWLPVPGDWNGDRVDTPG